LSFIVDPLAAVRVTFVLFASLAATGAYLLARRRFGLSRAAALTGAALFLFNGFFAYRMAIGHITFHPFALAPWLALLLLPGSRDAPPGHAVAGAIASAFLAGIVFAYEFHAGMIHAILPVALATAVVILIHGHLFGHRGRPWLLFVAAVAISLGLGADRLVAALHFLRNFPRDYYPLPGFADLGSELAIAVQSLFFRPPVGAVGTAMVDLRWSIEQHEMEYSLG